MEEIFGLLITGAVGAGLIIAAWFLRLRTAIFVRRSARAKGEIVGFDESSGDGVTYAPVIRFTTDGGETIEFTDSVYSNPPAGKIGDSIEILYHRGDARRARVAAFSKLYFTPLLLGGMGAIFLGIGFFGLLIKFLIWRS